MTSNKEVLKDERIVKERARDPWKSNAAIMKSFALKVKFL